MKLEEDDLFVQVENPVDFISLKVYGVDLSDYLLVQDLDGYFGMLNGPTYEYLVKYFWVRAEIYDKFAAKQEENEKVLLDPNMKGKTREDKGFKPFTRTEIRSNLMGIQVSVQWEEEWKIL